MGTGHREGRQLWAVVMAAQSGSQARADLNQLPQCKHLSPQHARQRAGGTVNVDGCYIILEEGSLCHKSK